MDIENLTDDELDRLASKLAGRLPTGRHGDKIVTTRRQLLAATLGGSAGVAALVKLGIDPATAQSAAGQVGTASSPEDVFAYNLDVQGALQSDLDAGGQAITNAGSVSTDEVTNNSGSISITSILKFNSGADLSGNSLIGLRQVGNATPSDLSQQEMLLDPVNDRIVWKDGAGTTRFFDFDGTL